MTDVRVIGDPGVGTKEIKAVKEIDGTRGASGVWNARGCAQRIALDMSQAAHHFERDEGADIGRASASLRLRMESTADTTKIGGAYGWITALEIRTHTRYSNWLPVTSGLPS